MEKSAENYANNEVFLKVPQQNSEQLQGRSDSDNGSYKLEIKITEDSFDKTSERTDPEGMAEGKSVKSEFDLLDFPINKSPLSSKSLMSSKSPGPSKSPVSSNHD